MINQLPPWITSPSPMSRQSEMFRQWHSLMLEHTLQNPPPFLEYLSQIEIRKILEAATDYDIPSMDELSPFIVQTRIYKRQFELIGWSYFMMLGQKLNNLQEKLSKHEFEKTLHEIGISAKEAQLSMLAVQDAP